MSVAQPEQRALQVLASLIDTATAFASLPSLLGGLLIVVIFGAAIVSLLGAVVISGGISGPLIQLSQLARRVQEGDLTARANVRSQDEVGVLEEAFNTMVSGLRERERERDIFGRVVSPEVREKLLNGKLELGGETRWVSVLFSDIRGFTTMVEAMNPQEAVAFLNEYLTEMAEAYPILINGTTAALKTRSDIVLENLGPLLVKGRAEPVSVYAVVECRKADGTVVRFARGAKISS